ncbi:MAG: cation diffusion facilitator family transporter [Chloroflexota bacterium]|nr:cation diffusion facilitator family transporter [Chloroflexota bacterium]
MTTEHRHDHEHDHAHDHAHDHEGHDHAHDHEHDHAHDHEHDQEEHDHEGHDHAHDGHGHDHGHGGHGHHHHGHGGHDHAHDLRGASKKSLIFALALIGGFMFVEVVGGILSGSLALLADAAHMLTDAASIALALFAMWIANRPAAAGSTFGFYRTEILAALANTVSLWLIAGWIFFEAYHRFFDTPEVEGPLMLSVGVVGLLVNIAAAWVLHRAAGESLNVEGAFQHVLADMMGSFGVIISGVLILAFADQNEVWYIADPIMSVLIGLLILKVSWGLFMRVFKVLLEGTPESVDIYNICSEMEDVDGVTLVHDVHAWTITSGYDAFTAHVFVSPTQAGRQEEILKQLRRIVYNHGLNHVTIQVELSVVECTEERHHVEHLQARFATQE